MKEDILEQIVEDFLQSQGYFTRHNLKFKPSPLHHDYVVKKDVVSSDIDVIGVHPTYKGVQRVKVVTCKSWQAGFNPETKLKELNKPSSGRGRDFWKHFRELWSPKWVEAFQSEIETTTGQNKFVYCIAVSHLTGKLNAIEAASLWMSDPTIAKNLAGCEFQFITMEEMWSTIISTVSKTPASSDIGRLAQLLKAAGVH